MNLMIVWKLVPDTVEELSIAADGKSLDAESLRFKLGDADEHALEQALLLKEQHGGKVTVVACEAPEVDDALWAALAKGADRAVRLSVQQTGLGTVALSHVLARFFASPAAELTSDTLLLTGSQAIDDLEGELAPYLAAALRLPYLGVVSGLDVVEGGRMAVAIKEFAGGLRGEFDVPLPAVLGIQSAGRPPRYVPVARVRAVMKSARIETADVPPPDRPARLEIVRLYKPEPTGRARLLDGPPESVADQLVEVLAKHGVI
jgi:electron transfer flavoprotein beta subunit